MKWILRISLALVAIIVLIAGVGFALPQNHEAARSAEFPRPPEDVFAVVSDFKSYPSWWRDIEKVDVIADQPGQARFREYMLDGPVIMAVVESSPPSRFVTKIDDPDQPFSGTWTFEIVPAGEGRSRLTITERGEIYNPVFRALARFVFGYTSTMDSCLAALGARLK